MPSSVMGVLLIVYRRFRLGTWSLSLVARRGRFEAERNGYDFAFDLARSRHVMEEGGNTTAMTEATDCQLLERYAKQGDEAAFRVLARRHAALVLRVCRRVLRDEHHAEDVVQATFLVLARKARALAWQASVGGWLSAVAHRLSLHARSLEVRRAQRECSLLSVLPTEDFPCPSDEPLQATAQRELSCVLQEELGQLPEKYRAPVILCYLEGKTNEQAARELGWPTGSMSRRLERARQLLRERLTRRGVAFFLAVVGMLLAPLRCGQQGPDASLAAQVMARFRRAEVPELVRRMERGEEVEPKRLLDLADLTARSTVLLDQHDPKRQHSLWRSRVLALETSSRDLQSALKERDQPATRTALGNLFAACQQCHQTFRD